MDDPTETQITDFANDLATFLLPYVKSGSSPLMLAGVMMSCTMELYTTALKTNEDIYKLLEVVAASVDDIRDKNARHLSRTVH